MSANTLLKIAGALSCSCDYILRGMYRIDEDDTTEQMYTEFQKGLTDKQRKLVEEILKTILEISADAD